MNKEVSVHIRNIIIWSLAIAYYFVINSFSITPANVSTAESKSVVNIVEKVSDVIQNKSETESNSWLSRRTLHILVRKTAHIINFFILAFLHCMLFFSYTRKELKTVVFALFMGFCGASLDEMTQMFVPGRSAKILDVFIDVTGTFLGCIFFILLFRKFVLRLKKRVIL